MEAADKKYRPASKENLPMTILALIKPMFNRLKNNCIYGSQEIPRWHPLYGKKCWRCGWYTRYLRLYDKKVITVYVYRFYCPETKKTYSLLPFFIFRYERHINTVIEEVLKELFCEKAGAEKLAEEPSPSPWTVRRWHRKFGSLLEDIHQAVDQFLISQDLSYLPAANRNPICLGIFPEILRKIQMLPISSSHLFPYGAFSYALYAHNIQNARV